MLGWCRTVGQWMCDYYDDVEQLKGFGAANTESLGELVWAFFEHWAWKHDYNNNVLSVRTGGFLTKSQKEWTRRVGNERHLVCIEVLPGSFILHGRPCKIPRSLSHMLKVKQLISADQSMPLDMEALLGRGWLSCCGGWHGGRGKGFRRR